MSSHGSGSGKPPPPARRRRSTSSRDEPGARSKAENEELRRTLARLREREAMLRAVLEALPAWIHVKDREGRYLFMNSALARVREADPLDVVGKTSPEVSESLAADPAAIAAAERQVLSTGESVDVPSYRVRLPGGQQRTRHMVKLPLRDDAGRVQGVVSWSEDVSDLVLADEALETHRRMLRTMIDVMPFAVSFVNPGGHLLIVNRDWCELAGCAPEDALGLTVEQVESIPEAVRTQLFSDTMDMIRNRVLRAEREFTMAVGDASPRHLIVTKALVVGPDDVVHGLVTGVTDITELRRSEQVANLAHQRLIDAMEALPATLFLYDARERLVHANSRAYDHFPHLRDVLQPGMEYREILSAAVTDVIVEDESEEEWVRQRLREFRHPAESFERAMKDGRILLGRDRRTSEGGTISIRFDITEQKRVQRELEQRERQIGADLALAADLQRAILKPVQVPGFLDVDWHFQPSRPVSGDLYHASHVQDGGWRFFIGDATGHGVAAAFLTILMQAGLNSTPLDMPPSELMTQLNRELLQYDLDGRFVSGICVCIRPDGHVELSNAGHPPALALLRARRRPERLESTSLPLGWFADAVYESDTLQLEPGDTLLLYTDGLSEWSAPDGQQFGEDATLGLAPSHWGLSPAQLIERVLASARRNAQGHAPVDDLTLFALSYRQPEQS